MTAHVHILTVNINTATFSAPILSMTDLLSKIRLALDPRATDVHKPSVSAYLIGRDRRFVTFLAVEEEVKINSKDVLDRSMMTRTMINRSQGH
jgi:hypothetical protein